MSLLAGTGNLSLPKKRVPRESESSAYEESDEEVPGETFQVRKFVDHKLLNKGHVYRQTKDVHHTFDVAAMERSKFNYAFKVRWAGYKECDDTWEPVESFSTSLEKKLRKYCKKKNIKLPKEILEWMLPMGSGEEDSSGSDDTDGTKLTPPTKPPVSRLPSATRPPAPPIAGHKADRHRQLQQDLALSPSPSPRAQKQSKSSKKGIDALFDDSDDEVASGSKRKEDKREGVKIVIKNPTGTPQVVRNRKEERKTTPTPTPSRKTKPPRDDSSDREESQRKKEEKKKKLAKAAERDRKNSILSDEDRKEEEKRKRKERYEREKKAAELRLAEEEKQKKKEKQAKMLAEQAAALSGLLHTEDAPSSAQTSHRDLELKKKKKKIEVKMKEMEKKEDHADSKRPSGSKKEDLKDPRKVEKKKAESTTAPSAPPVFRIPKKKPEDGDERRDDGPPVAHTLHPPSATPTYTMHVEMTPMKMPPVPMEKEEDFEERRKREREERKEKEKRHAQRIMDEEARRLRREGEEAVEMAEYEEERRVIAKRRLEIIDERLEKFEASERMKERARLEAWAHEEERWRKSMYDRGLWPATDNHKLFLDAPFDFLAERQLTGLRGVRTLRRCVSLERLLHSQRRLSSLHSMDTMASEAESLAAALTDLRVGRQEVVYRRMRERDAARCTNEEKEAKKADPITPAMHDLASKEKVFVEETLVMAAEHGLLSEVITEQVVRDMCRTGLGAFLSLDHAALITMLETIKEGICINMTVLRFVHLFSDVVNLVQSDDPSRRACDQGEHLKCRMLLTLLMVLSDSCRAGDGDECLLPPNALYDAMHIAAPCQIRALIRGGATFDDYYDEATGRNAAHRMMETYNLIKLVWLIERGLCVNSAVLANKQSDLSSEMYDRPWKLVKECHEKMAFVSQLHSQRLTARSVAWTRAVPCVADFNLRPLTLVHTLNPFAYIHRMAAVTLCNSERKGFDPSDAVLLAVHSATIRQGKGLRPATRKSKKNVAELRIPFFVIERAHDDPTFKVNEEYLCERAKLTICHLDSSPSTTETVELTLLGSNGPTTVFTVPKKQASVLLTARRWTETALRVLSPPEHSVLLAQYLIVPFRPATGKFND